jgi:hypothetical protein
MSRAKPSTFGNKFEDYAQQKQNREGYKTDSDWLESFGNQQLEISSWPVSTSAIFLGKGELVSV